MAPRLSGAPSRWAATRHRETATVRPATVSRQDLIWRVCRGYVVVCDRRCDRLTKPLASIPSKTAYAELVRVDADGAAAYELTLLLTPEEARQAVAVLTGLLAVVPGERQVAEKEFDDARPRTKAARASFGSLSTQMRQP